MFAATAVACDPATQLTPDEIIAMCVDNPDCVDGVPPELMDPEDERSQPTREEAFPDLELPVEEGFLRTAGGILEVGARRVGDEVIVEGDIRIPADEFDANFFESLELAQREPVIPEGTAAAATLPLNSRRWSNSIPYTVDASVTDRDRVFDAIAEWERRTPYRFTRRSSCTTGSCLKFVDGDGCSSFVGRFNSPQEITIQNDHWTGIDYCNTGTVIHEIGHALGFFHEQARSDRGNHVRILWDNIQSGKESNFRRYVDRGLSGIDIGPYDYRSIMHYAKDQFGERVWGFLWKKTTIETRHGQDIGNRDRLSAGDVEAAFLRFSENVAVFRDRDYDGTWQIFGPGTYMANLGELWRVGNDTVSSVVVPPGWSVTLCAHENVGPCETYRSSATRIATTVDNRVSRIIVDDDPAPANPGYCTCEDSGFANICQADYNGCNRGFSPVCNPDRFSCGGCVCEPN